MKIIFDNIVFSLQKAGGISTYWFELYSRILRDYNDVFFVDRENDNIVAKQHIINKENTIKTGIANLLLDRFVNISLKKVTEKFIFHSSYNRITTNKNAKQVLTLHDFVHEKFYAGVRRFLHSYQKGNAIEKADAIIVISENTKKDLLLFFPNINPNKVSVIYNGVSDDFFRTKEQVVTNDFLFIGSREKYKNFDFAVKAIAQTDSFKLNIVGSILRKDEIVMLNKFIPGRWKLFNNIDNSKLNELYNNAFALIYPSSYEGFGIPLLEAMKAGCPFIAYNSSSIPEVAGDAGILIDKLDVSLFKETVLMIAVNREEIVKKGFNQANKFSWEKCYQETLQVYKELYKS
jgi:mannosyltransferase